MPHARAAAEPPDDPAADLVGSKGLPVAPNTGLRVFPPAAHSGTLVLPTTTPPAARRQATKRSSFSGTWLRNSVLPNVVSRPPVSAVSLIATGKP
jgi:hypothetical protein